MILYDDSKHRYYNDKDETYTSATQLVSLFTDDFDTFMQSVMYANKHGETANHWKDSWKETSDKALVRGNKAHKEREAVWMDWTSYQLEMLWLNRYRTPYNYMSLPDGTYSELTWWNHPLKIAGRSDKAIIKTMASHILKHRDGRQATMAYRVLDIDDYKTNAEISTRGYYSEKSNSYRRMKYPVAHLEDCDLAKFSLQLSVYMYCGEQMGFIPGKMRIIHVPHDEEGNELPEIVYPLEYRRKEVISMAKHAHVH